VRKTFKGYIQVYTGNGKGKTTAALGLALRAAGRGFSSFIGQFLKGQRYGELNSVRRLSPLITIRQFGRRGFVHVTENPCDEDIRRARRGFEACLRAMLSGRFRIVVLDEINVALYFRLLERKDLERLIDRKPADVELVLTGRYAPAWLIRRADLVTEMKDRRHYYDKGVCARIGIEK